MKQNGTVFGLQAPPSTATGGRKSHITNTINPTFNGQCLSHQMPVMLMMIIMSGDILPFLFQHDLLPLFTKRQYPSMRSAMSSAAHKDSVEIVSGSMAPATLSCTSPFRSVSLLTVCMDCSCSNSASNVGCGKMTQHTVNL